MPVCLVIAEGGEVPRPAGILAPGPIWRGTPFFSSCPQSLVESFTCAEQAGLSSENFDTDCFYFQPGGWSWGWGKGRRPGSLGVKRADRDPPASLDRGSGLLWRFLHFLGLAIVWGIQPAAGR